MGTGSVVQPEIKADVEEDEPEEGIKEETKIDGFNDPSS